MPMIFRALILTAVNLLLRMVGTSFQVILSGRIGASGVGLLQLTLSVGSMAMTAGIAGIRTATMYLTARELGRRRPENIPWFLSGCIRYSLLCSGAIALGLYIFSPVIAEFWIGDRQVLPALRLLAGFLPVSCMCAVLTGAFTAKNRIGTLACVEVAEQLLSMGISLGLLMLDPLGTPENACRAVVLGSGVGSTMVLVALTLLWKNAAPGARVPTLKPILRTALPLALADDLKAGISTTENLMVPKRLGLHPGTADPLGAFGTICGMVFPVMMLPASLLYGLSELLIPELARCAAGGNRERIRHLATDSLRGALVYGCFFGGILYLAGPALCQKLYSSPEAGSRLRCYGVLVPMLYCDTIIDAMIKGLGQQTACVRYNILTSFLDVVFLFLLLPRWGLEGYFVSFAVTHLINFLLSLFRLLKITGLKVPWRKGLLPLGAAVFGAGAATVLPSPVLGGVAFCLLYGSCLVLFTKKPAQTNCAGMGS